jgi:RHS repeat-associated protein
MPSARSDAEWIGERAAASARVESRPLVEETAPPTASRRWGASSAAARRLGICLALMVPVEIVAPATLHAQAVTVEYYSLDALGSVRVVTGANGQVLQRHDYQPFGEEYNPPTGQPDKRLFTGKERDAETGLDYFGARYYRANIGRFTTVDPVYTWQENLADPQRWNRYAYARNNPLTFLDMDGRWPTRGVDVHRQIFALALPQLSKAQLDLMASGSYWADDVQGDLARAHAMKDPGQTLSEAEGLYRGWVRTYETDAARRTSLWHFGVAGHAIADSFSPSHKGFQTWDGYGLGTPRHLIAEKNLSVLTLGELRNMVQAIQDAYYQTFGAQAFTAATGFLYSRPITRSVLVAPTV